MRDGIAANEEIRVDTHRDFSFRPVAGICVIAGLWSWGHAADCRVLRFRSPGSPASRYPM